VIRTAALRGLGVPGATITRRCGEGERWKWMLPGVIALGSGTPTPRQRVAAAMLYGGPDAMITGLEACRRHGLRRGPDPAGQVHLLVPDERQLRSSQFVIVERTTRLPRPHVRDDTPLAPVTRACLDGARRLRSAADVAELIADAVQRRLTTPARLAVELRAGSQRGSAIPRRVLIDVSEGIRSTAERDARRLLARSGLPEPWWNVKIYHESGHLLGIADAWFDEVALTWEINSYAWHLAPSYYAREVKRTAGMTAASVLVLPVLPTDLRDDPEGSMSELVAAYGVAQQRPRPPVRAVRRSSDDAR
jgi:hypothetical protein